MVVDDDFSSLQGRAKSNSGAAPLLRLHLQGVDGHHDSGGPQPKVVGKKIFFTLLRDVKIWIKEERRLLGRWERCDRQRAVSLLLLVAFLPPTSPQYGRSRLQPASASARACPIC